MLMMYQACLMIVVIWCFYSSNGLFDDLSGECD